jgi:hypothetical protein
VCDYKEDNDMKYYYNGKLVRTSKNHIYTHAVIDISNMKVIGCRGSLEKAESLLTSELNYIARSIENGKNKLKCFKEGKPRYGWKDGKRVWYSSFKSTDTEESILEGIRYSENYLETIKQNYKIVELESK